MALNSRRRPAVVSIVGKKGAGKTTLLEGLLPALKKRGLRVATVKHDVHGFEMDHPGKDSYRHKHAGADASLISSPFQIGMVRDVDRDHTIEELVERFLNEVDLVLTEGYRREPWPKVEIHRRGMPQTLVSGPDTGLIALVSDEPLSTEVRTFGLEDADDLAAWLVGHFGLDRNAE